MKLPRGVFVHELPAAEAINEQILRDFIAHEHDEGVRRTHLINGRFENIYLDMEHVPTLTRVMQAAREAAKVVLDLSCPPQAGFWFNAMYPGHATAVHSHDDYNECLSGVYYVTAPDNSGDLILHTEQGPFHLSPRAGRFVFFPPEMLHEVSENRSTAFRLSIGMNFGTPAG